jgi:hypothetical protein
MENLEAVGKSGGVEPEGESDILKTNRTGEFDYTVVSGLGEREDWEAKGR